MKSKQLGQALFHVIIVSALQPSKLIYDKEKTLELQELIATMRGKISTCNTTWDFLVTTEFTLEAMARFDIDQVQQLLENKCISQLMTPKTLKRICRDNTLKEGGKALVNSINAKQTMDLSFLYPLLRRTKCNFFQTTERKYQREVRYGNFDREGMIDESRLPRSLAGVVERSRVNARNSVTKYSVEPNKISEIFQSTVLKTCYSMVPFDCWFNILEYLCDLQLVRIMCSSRFFYYLGKYARNDYYRFLCMDIIKNAPFLTHNIPKKRNLPPHLLPAERDYFRMLVEQLLPMFLQTRWLHFNYEYRPYLELDIHKGVQDDSPIGGTFYGGLPDLAFNLTWPTDHEFLCQINCKDICWLFGARRAVPSQGILYFFISPRKKQTVMLYSETDDPSRLMPNTTYQYGEAPKYHNRCKLKVLDSVRQFAIVPPTSPKYSVAFGNAAGLTNRIAEGFFIHHHPISWTSHLNIQS